MMRILIPEPAKTWSLIPDSMKNPADPDPTHCDSRFQGCDPWSRSISGLWSLIPYTSIPPCFKLLCYSTAFCVCFVCLFSGTTFGTIFLWEKSTCYKNNDSNKMIATDTISRYFSSIGNGSLSITNEACIKQKQWRVTELSLISAISKFWLHTIYRKARWQETLHQPHKQIDLKQP